MKPIEDVKLNNKTMRLINNLKKDGLMDATIRCAERCLAESEWRNLTGDFYGLARRINRQTRGKYTLVEITKRIVALKHNGEKQ